jgi:GNAT superfamily N-acetyltransferase
MSETTATEKIIRIQNYLRQIAHRQYEALSLPPFTMFFHPSEPLTFFNYAIPDQPCGGDLKHILSALDTEFKKRQRLARFEFFEAFAPELPAALRLNGFVEEDRQWSMLCTQADFQPPAAVAGLEVIVLRENASPHDVRDFLLAQKEGFEPDSPVEISEEEIRQQINSLDQQKMVALLGRLNGEPAGAAVFNQPIGGVSEVVGVATRVNFRRQGIGAFLTAQAVQLAFAQGADTLCLTAADERAGRVYGQVGFKPFSIMLAYIKDERGL